MKTDNLPRLPWSNLYPKALAAMNKTRPDEFRTFGVDMDLRDVDEDQWDAWGFPGKYPKTCLLYTSPSPRDKRQSRMPSSA